MEVLQGKADMLMFKRSLFLPDDDFHLGGHDSLEPLLELREAHWNATQTT